MNISIKRVKYVHGYKYNGYINCKQNGGIAISGNWFLKCTCLKNIFLSGNKKKKSFMIFHDKF